MAKLLGNVIFRGRIHVVTGLHIGASRDKLEIGGVDSPVLRDPANKYPYIPGSSLKGKMRMLSEFAEDRVKENNGKPCQCGECVVCIVFGNPAEVSEKAAKGPTRLTIRDAYPSGSTITMWEKAETELLYTEYKGENTLDRITSAANPRFFERVIPKSEFELEMVYSVYDFEGIDDVENLKYIFQALRLLEHSALGGHGSRGYGKVLFKLAEPLVFPIQDYQQGTAAIPEFKDADFNPLSELNPDNIVQRVKEKLNR